MIKDLDISDLRTITEVIKKTHSYDFTNYAMSSLKRRIVRVLENYKISVETLISRLQNQEGFIEEFLTEITVNVTEMFRDPSFWLALKKEVIPSILVNHENFKIWHAGCSSGEEVYSMAILLKEMGILDKVTLFASDIDPVILDRAKKGEYPLKNMELNEKNYIRFDGATSLKDYYTEKDGKAIMDKSLAQAVTFKKHDLVNGPAFTKVDLILCRNVMIYFNQKLQNDVLNKFHSSLFKYGYLAIGSKESLIWCDIVKKFILVNNEEKVYRKIKD